MFARLRDTPRRRGMAPLEFVLALPLLVMPFVVLFVIGWTGQARLDQLNQARLVTWEKRNETPSDAALDLDLDALRKRAKLGPPPSPELASPAALVEKGSGRSGGGGNDFAQGLLEATETAPIPVSVSFLDLSRIQIKARHAVLGGSWDHRATSVESGRRLQLGDLMKVFERTETSASILEAALEPGRDFDDLRMTTSPIPWDDLFKEKVTVGIPKPDFGEPKPKALPVDLMTYIQTTKVPVIKPVKDQLGVQVAWEVTVILPSLVEVTFKVGLSDVTVSATGKPLAVKERVIKDNLRKKLGDVTKSALTSALPGFPPPVKGLLDKLPFQLGDGIEIPY
ncbi:MAG: hypothetical protein AB7I30_07720 [Isosphaeraceae bacterium]